jgi:hypothetical protein
MNIDNFVEDPEKNEDPGTSSENSKTEESKPEVPKFFSQLRKEIADSEDTKKYLTGIKDLNDLVSSYAGKSKSLESAIIVPGENASEDEIKAFFGKLGVPEDKTGYKLSDYDFQGDEFKLMKDSFMEAAHRGALSNKQAQHMWKHLLATTKASKAMIEARQQKVKDSFEPGYHKLMEGSYPVEEERTAAIKGEIGLAKAFLQKTGLAEKFEQSGLIYDPQVIHAIAQAEKSHKPSFIQGSGNDKDSEKKTGGISYGSEFSEFIGEK